MWNWSENQIEIVLIRHGATKANKEHRYLGKTDEALSVEGIKALQKEKNKGSYPQIDYLFSSPMKRCLKTAEILYPEKKPIVIPDWEEMDFGAFEGKNYLELQSDETYQAWIDSNGTLPFPEGESREAFIKRCEQGFYKLLAKLTEKESPSGEPVLRSENKSAYQQDLGAARLGLIIHGGTIMALLSSFYGGDYFDYQIANGKGYICKLKCNDKQIRFEALEKI